MKLSILGIEIHLRKSGSKTAPITLDDVRHANDEVLDYIRGLGEQEIERRIRSVTCSLEQGVDAVRRVLLEKGIVVIPDFIPPDALGASERSVQEVRDRISDFMASGEASSETSDVLLQRGSARLSGYPALSGYGKAVVQIREGQDEGMVDIFNIDQWKSPVGEALRPYFERPEVAKIMEADSAKPEARNLNLYLNSGVTQTRGFHVDSYSKQLKGFVYLEDCLTLGDGPYTYVKGSHHETAFIRINKHVSSILPNHTETPFVSLRNIVPVLARKGSLVISDQGGSHRGFPQSEGHRRAVAVMNFR